MPSEESVSGGEPAPRRPKAPDAAGGPARASHPRSFKLLFAAQREPGRSNVSLIKPLGLPATVAGKFYARPAATDEEDRMAEEAALERVRRMFADGPRDKYDHPVLSSYEYGWWGWAARRDPPVLRHHLRDSAWLRERLRVLAADAPRRQRS